MLYKVRLLAIALALGILSPITPVSTASAQTTRCDPGVIVSAGDTLARIASYCGTTVQALLAANPEIRNPNTIYVGQVIRMPGTVVTRPDPPPPAASDPCGSAVRVRPGDTLARIAFRCRTTVGRLLAANPQIRNPNWLYVGMLIRVPGGPVIPGLVIPGPVIPDPDRPSLLRVSGTVTAEGVTCQAMRGDDGRLYTLAGDIGRLSPGERIEVVGYRARASICQQGITIDPERIRRFSSAPEPAPGIDVTGTITREGVTCLAMRGDDGRLYTLAGDTDDFGPGDRVRVRGTRAEVSICQQGITIAVDRIREVP